MKNHIHLQLRAALCLLAFIVFTSADIHAANVDAHVFSVSGTVEFAPPGSSSYAPLTKGATLPIGSTVRTGDDGVAVLVTTPGSAIQIGNSSVVKINKLAFAKTGGDVTQRQAVVQLTTGVVSALIDPSTPKITDFQVQTPEGAAAARGTFYAVLVYHGKTYVGVKEGKVAVKAAGQ
jgi:hypothetical protein